MDWTIKDRARGQSQPRGRGERQRVARRRFSVDAVVGAPLTLDATGTRDPDGNALTYRWFFYPEAGTGIPGQPVVRGRSRADRWWRAPAKAASRPGPKAVRREPAPRVTIERRRHARASTVHAASRRHRAHHPRRRGQREPDADVRIGGSS